MARPNLPPSKSLTELTLSGLNWKFLSTAVQVVLTFAVGVVLARLILPQDFGLLGMALIFTGLAGVFTTLGMGPAIVQRQALTDAHIRTAVTLSTLLGLAITCMLWISSDTIALFFGDPRVSPVLKAMSLTFLLKGPSSTSQGLLRRKLQFKGLFFVELVSYLVGYTFFAVPMAFMGYGVWSLVVGTLAKAIISCGLLLFLVKPPLKPVLRRKETRELLGFGSGFTLICLLNYGATNVDSLVIGKFLSSAGLGFYSRAFGLMMLPRQFATALS